MAIITISRGTLSGGSVLAECLSRRLRYRSIDLNSLLRKAATSRVSEYDLRAALEQPPAFPGTSNHRRYTYQVLIQAALLQEVRGGCAVYHGLAGHLLLKGVPGLIRLRVIAPLEARVRLAAERLHLSERDAAAHITETDRDRRQWTQFLYGVDWSDPSEYDLVVNLERLALDNACDLVIALIERGAFELKPEDEAALNDLAIAGSVRKALTLSPSTLHLEVEVESRRGSVVVRGEFAEDDDEAIRRVAATVPGVCGVTIELHRTP
jgi:cytidylate kinase